MVPTWLITANREYLEEPKRFHHLSTDSVEPSNELKIHVFRGNERTVQSIRGHIDVVIDVSPMRHERAHVEVFWKGDERRDLLVESIGMFKALLRKVNFVLE